MTVQLIVHIDEPPDPDVARRAQTVLQAERGVAGAELNREKSHLMMVRYDPAAARAGEIVAALRRSGLHAQAVGL
jgi:hypothetical protein